MAFLPSRFDLQAMIGWLAPCGLLFLVGLVVAFVLHTRGQHLADAEAETVATVERLAGNAARLFDAADFVIKEAAKDIGGRSWDDIEGSQELWAELRDRATPFPYIENVWINDATGRLRLTTFAFPAPLNIAADRDFFLANRQPTKDAFISAPTVGRVTGKPTFLLSRRLDEPDGSLRGIVSVTIDPEYFSDFFKSLNLAYQPRIILFRQVDLGVLVRQPGPPIVALQPAADALKAAIAAAPEKGVARDGERLRAYSRLDPWPLYVAASIETAAVLDAWYREMVPFGLAIGLAVSALAGLSVLGFRQMRAEKRRLAELEARVEERTESLRTALSELSATLVQKQQLVDQKDLLMRELNHRVKNSLQLVASMLSLQSLSTTDPEVRHHLEQAGRRVRSVSMVHELLYKAEEGHTVHFGEYLCALCHEMQRSALPAERGWTLSCDSDPIDLPADQAIPLGIIAGELLLNAGKYAYPCDGPKPVEVTVRQNGRRLSMTVADRGVGLPETFTQAPSTSLGMRLITALVLQLEGRLDIERRAKGAAFTVEVPLMAAE